VSRHRLVPTPRSLIIANLMSSRDTRRLVASASVCATASRRAGLLPPPRRRTTTAALVARRRRAATAAESRDGRRDKCRFNDALAAQSHNLAAC